MIHQHFFPRPCLRNICRALVALVLCVLATAAPLLPEEAEEPADDVVADAKVTA